MGLVMTIQNHPTSYGRRLVSCDPVDESESFISKSQCIDLRSAWSECGEYQQEPDMQSERGLSSRSYKRASGTERVWKVTSTFPDERLWKNKPQGQFPPVHRFFPSLEAALQWIGNLEDSFDGEVRWILENPDGTVVVGHRDEGLVQ